MHLSFALQMIDDFVQVDPSPTEKQKEWKEATRLGWTFN